MPQSVKQKLAQTICDSLALQAKCMQDLTVIRMQMIKPALHAKNCRLAGIIASP